MIFAISGLFLVILGFFELLFQITPDLTNLLEVLTWLASAGGASVATGAVMALIIENWPAWHNFPRIVKFLVPIILSFGIALGANYLLLRPGFIDQVAPMYALIVTLILAWLGSQVAYIYANTKGYAASAKLVAEKRE